MAWGTKPYSLSHALCKSKKIFHGVSPCLVMMYHQTNLDCKSFSISEDLVEMIVALTLNIAKWYFWMILWLMMMHHHTKFDRSEILSGQTFTEVQNLHCDLDLEYSKATFPSLWTCTVKLGWSPQKISSSVHIIEIVIFDCMNEIQSLRPWPWSLKKIAYDALAYNNVSPYWVWLQMVQRCVRYHPN